MKTLKILTWGMTCVGIMLTVTACAQRGEYIKSSQVQVVATDVATELEILNDTDEFTQLRVSAQFRVQALKNEIDKLLLKLTNIRVSGNKGVLAFENSELKQHFLVESNVIDGDPKDSENVIDEGAVIVDSDAKSVDMTSSRIQFSKNSKNTKTKIAIDQVLALSIDPNSVTEPKRNSAEYNFSVVYVYDEQPPWDGMWNTLEEAGEEDKWRGINRRKHTYFIYVGAYNTKKIASNRQVNLDLLTGESPSIRARDDTTYQLASRVQ